MQSNIEAADGDIKEAQQQLEHMGGGKLKAADKRVQDLAMKLAVVKGEQESLTDSVNVRIYRPQT